MKFVLTPIDFSEITARVVEEAVRLTWATEAGHLVLLHVVPPWESLGKEGQPEAGGDLLKALGAAAENKMTWLRARIEGWGISTHSVCLVGNPAVRIIEQARYLDAGCIVIGAHGNGPGAGDAMGSTANGVVHGAHCPVIVVPREGRRSKKPMHDSSKRGQEGKGGHA